MTLPHTSPRLLDRGGEKCFNRGMAHTDKDVPARLADFENADRRYGKSRNYAKAMRFEKKRGHRNQRRGKTKFWDTKTCRTWRYYY